MSIAEKFEIIADAVYDKAVIDKDEQIWKSMTMNGTREPFGYFLAYSDWSGYEFIKPIKPKSSINHFCYSTSMTELPKNIDFSEIFSTLDDSYGYRRSVFGHCRNLKIVPDLNMRAIGGLEEWFTQCRKLHTIELLRVKKETIYNSTFSGCDALQNIRFDGEIGQNISFTDSPLLSVESLVNIIKHLVDFSGTSDAGTRILTIHPTAFERLNQTYSSPSEVGIDFSGSWLSYINSIGWNM